MRGDAQSARCAMRNKRAASKSVVLKGLNDREIVLQTLRDVARDAGAPAAARAQAARTLAEIARMIGAQREDDTQDKDPSELTLGEIDRELTRLRRGAGKGA